jgi:hypothetical protein
MLFVNFSIYNSTIIYREINERIVEMLFVNFFSIQFNNYI